MPHGRDLAHVLCWYSCRSIAKEPGGSPAPRSIPRGSPSRCAASGRYRPWGYSLPRVCHTRRDSMDPGFSSSATPLQMVHSDRSKVVLATSRIPPSPWQSRPPHHQAVASKLESATYDRARPHNFADSYHRETPRAEQIRRQIQSGAREHNTREFIPMRPPRVYGETNLVRNHTHSRDPLTKEVAMRWMLALSKIGIVFWRYK